MAWKIHALMERDNSWRFSKSSAPLSLMIVRIGGTVVTLSLAMGAIFKIRGCAANAIGALAAKT
jgi:hypothetical protein